MLRSPDAHSPAPLQIAIPDGELDDLRERLRRTRWPEAETVSDWSQGVPLAYMQGLCDYWACEYDWRPTERWLNGSGQLTATVDGLDIHLLHVRSPHPNATPLLLTHGWPGSVLEFRTIIDPLVDPVAHGGTASDAFDVVCPSLPGYGFSQKPDAPGWSIERIARAWCALMDRLGYERFVAQGGDWGAIVSLSIAEQVPKRLLALQLTMPIVGRRTIAACGEPGPDERAALDRLAAFRRDGSGYSRQQSTRPQTLGYGLLDSPAAQCAWIVEKFAAWMDCGGDPETVLSRDELLDNVMMYWLPATGASSARLYWESLRGSHDSPIDVPTGLSIFPREINPITRRWAEQRFRDLRVYDEHERGGHFAALEQPQALVDDIRSLLRVLRS